MSAEQKFTHPLVKTQPNKDTCAYLGACIDSCQLVDAFNAAIKLSNSDQALVAVGSNRRFQLCSQMPRFYLEIKKAKARVGSAAFNSP